MKITSGSEALKNLMPADAARFVGRAGLASLIAETPQAGSIFAALVRFEARARNHWHSHPGGQLLFVIEGDGWVQVRGQAAQHIEKDDVVTAEPGEEHWHGAGSHGPMTHLAVQSGKTRWLEESEPPPDYARPDDT